MSDQEAEAVLKEAEKIIEGHSEALHAMHDEVEQKVTEFQRIACITHLEAHQAYTLFYRSMFASAKFAGVPLDTFMQKQSADRIKIWLGMMAGIVGAPEPPSHILFQFPDGFFDEAPGE